MKKILMISLALLMGVGIVVAQDRPAKKSRAEMMKEFREFKMKYLAQELDLKDDQIKPFFEIYDQMLEEKRKVFEQTRALERKIKKTDNVSEQEYAELSKALTDLREQDVALDRKYDEKFISVINNKQLYQLKVAEEKFRKKMSEMRHKNRRNPKR